MSHKLLRNVLLFAAALSGAVASQAQFQVPIPFSGTTAVGQQSAALTVTVTMTASGVSAAPIVIDQGATSPAVTPGDFAIASPSGSCAANQTYTVGYQCTVNVVFQPAFPGQRPGAVEVLSADKTTVLGSQLIVGTGKGGLPVLVPGNIQTLAGDGQFRFTGDGILATSAALFLPTGVVTDAAGNIFISDSNNNRIRRVDYKSGLISTIAGTGTPGYSGDNGLATLAMVNTPGAIVMDGAGNLYFADTGNDIIRRIDAVSGIITTVAGTPSKEGFSGDGAQATSALLTSPQSITFDPSGNLIIADSGNQVIRKVNAQTGVITTIAGIHGVPGYNGDGIPATTANLGDPFGVAYSPDGTLYIADLNNNRVRSINSLGIIQTVVGSTGQRGYAGDGMTVGSGTILNNPAGVFFDPAGDLFIADSGNNRVRMVTAGNQQINTIAGDGLEEYDGDGAAANIHSLYGPYVVYLDGPGNLFIADFLHQRIREVTADLLAFNYGQIRVDKTSAPQVTTLQNEGNDNLDVTSYVYNQSALDAATTTCVIGMAETFGTGCNLGVEFAPTVVGTGIVGTLTVDSNAPNALPVVQVSGDVLSVNPTSLSLISSINPSLVANPVTFTATVSSSNTSLTGTVAFFDGATQIGSIAIVNNSASYTTAGLTLGSHTIMAKYSGDTQDAAAQSSLVQVVKQTPSVVLAANPNPTTVTTSITLTATVSAPTGTPTGSIVFYDGTTAIGSSNLNVNGIATYSTSSLTAGTHSLTAQYSGDTSNATATSNAVNEVINQATSTITIATSASPVAVGTSVTFTATVTGTSTDVPTGNVNFTDGKTLLGTSTLNTSGIATFPTAALAPGTHTIVAAYVGDLNNAASSSVGLVQIVSQIGTTTALTSSLNPANAGAQVNLTATVAMAAGATADGTITGTVTFTDGPTTLGTAPLNATGQAVLAVSTLTVGTHAIIATYSGNTNYATSSSSALGEVIQSTATTLALGASASPIAAGQTETFTATLTSGTSGVPTGSVSFHDGAAVIGTGTVSAQGVATFSTTSLAVGTHTVTAVYAGDPNYQASTSSAVTVVVQLAPTTTALATSANPSVLGQSLTITATVTSITANPTGNVNFMDGATVLASAALSGGVASYSTSGLTFGTHVLTAVYVGDSIHATSTSTAVNEQIVETAPETLTSSLNPAVSGTNVVFTATVTGQSGVMPTGQVTFKDGATILGAVTLVNGVATFPTNTLSVGTHPITASYAGDANYAATTASLTQTITNANTTIALTASVNPATYATPVSLTAVITSNGGVATGIVTFTDGTATVGTATLDGTGKAVLTTSTLAPGSHSIVANYAGDGKASASVSTPLTVIVKELTQTAVASSANPATTLSQITFTATVTNAGVGVPTGNVTFSDGSTTLGTIAVDTTGVATFAVPSLTAGSHSITASYAGDGSDFPSTSTALTETVNLRPTTTSLTGVPTNPANPNEVTLVAVVSGLGTPSPSGIVTFTYGSITLGTATVGSTGVATLQIFLQQMTENIVASYGGDTNYSSSASPSTAITTGTATQFTINVTPGSATLASKQRTTVLVTLTSLGSFADTMNLGCLGLPYAATCTFSNDSVKLNANGTVSANLTIDTGNPLGSGAHASLRGLTKSSVLECLLPLGALLGFGLRRRRKLAGLFAVLMVAALTLTATGCAGLQINGTPPGTYNFTVGATGAGTGASESQTFTLTVTQ